MLAGQFAMLAAVTRRAPPGVRSRHLCVRAGWLVTAVSWLGLLGLNRLGRRSGGPLTDALDAGLGAGRRTGTGGLWQRPAGTDTARPPGVMRMLRSHRDYAHDTDISYGPYGSRNHLDIWRCPDLDRDGRAPVLVQVPGGAWMVGTKRQQAYPLMSHLAGLGWVCVAINYRLSPRSTWPDQIAEPFRAASAITYVSADAPPFFVLHGRNDSLIPVEQARAFTARLREVSGQPVAYAEMPFAQHAFDIFGSARAAHAAVAVEQFLAEIYERTTAASRIAR
jgi:acetyl esterase/lipase